MAGGGIRCVESSPTIISCTITDNVVSGDDPLIWGGGIFCSGSSPTISNCTISGNTAEGHYPYGGGIYCFAREGGSLIANCTITQTEAVGEHARGGGLYCPSNSPRIRNCIFWNNTPEEIYTLYASPSVTYSDVLGGWPGLGNIDADPLFVDPDNDDYHLSPGSPCIDSGCNGALPADTTDLDDDGDTSEVTPLDLDGEGRFFDDPDTPDTGCGFVPMVDMGVYEFGDTGPQPCPGDMDGDRDVDHADLGILLSLWGATDECDLDCDGDIDHADLGILLAHWGEGCP